LRDNLRMTIRHDAQRVMPHFVERTPLLTRRRWFVSAIVASAWSATSRAAPGPKSI
jgi:hypothetical protein